MKLLQSLTIKVKVFLLVIIPSIIFLLYVLYNNTQINSLADSSHQQTERFEQIVVSKEINQLNTAITLVAMDSIIDKDQGAVSAERLQEINTLFAEFNKIKSSFLNAADTEAERQNVQDVVTALEKLEPVIKVKLKNMVESRASEEKWVALDDEIDEIAGSIGDKIDAVIASINEEVNEANQQMKMQEDAVMENSIYALLVVFIIMITLGTLISKNILDALNKMLSITHDLAKGDGDLTQRILINSKDEIRAVADNINAFIEKVQISIRDTKELSSENSAISHELSATSLQVGKNVEKSAEIISKTTHKTSEITAEIIYAVEDAQKSKNEILEANSMLSEARDDIISLTNMVQSGAVEEAELALSIENLSKEMDQVKEILNVISDIADQTNLLALNAAIEAARAGEHGRGFAVVADEVRKLAERTQKTLSEINATINIMVQSSSSASEQMNINSKKMDELSQVSSSVEKKINATTNIVNNATLASDKTVKDFENAGANIKMIAQGIEEINLLSSENARSVEEISSAAEHLNSMTASLTDRLVQFRT